MQNTLSTPIISDPTQSFNAWMLAHQARIEAILDAHLPASTVTPVTLHAAMRYSATNGGKRIRALLCYATAELCGTPLAIADAAACAVELIHAYSLVHDDMPCMDDDDLRRGKPSCHKQYDDATALLVGDALQTLAFNVLSQKNLTVFDRHLAHNNHANLVSSASPRHQDAVDLHHAQLTMVNLLASAAGSRGMAGGQAIDLAATGQALTQDALEHMHQLKTGALIEAAVMLCTVHLNEDIPAQQLKSALRQYAQCVGLAFQVVDDILDVEADTATLGKTAGKDSMANKATFVRILGLHAAKAYAETTFKQAIFALKPYGESALRLNQLAVLITQRQT